MHFSLGVKIQGKIVSSLQPFAGLVARISGSHPDYPGSIPGQGTKSSLHTMAHCHLTKIRLSTHSIQGTLLDTMKGDKNKSDDFCS